MLFLDQRKDNIFGIFMEKHWQILRTIVYYIL